MDDLILFPFNGNAREAIAVVDAINQNKKTWNIIGFVDQDADLLKAEFLKFGVLGGHEIFTKYPKAKVLAVPGRPENHLQRKQIIDSLQVAKDRFATLIHPFATLSESTTIGYNSLVMASVITTVNVKIGNHCVILPSTVLSHDVIIDDYCLIGSNVSVSGNVTIQPFCYVGSGAKIRQEIVIKEGTLVGMGAVVIKPTNKHTVVVGNPAKFLRSNLP